MNLHNLVSRTLLFLLPAMPVSLARAQSIDVSNVFGKVLERRSKLPGEFLPYLSVDLHARVNGYVDKIEVDVGSKVKSGQLLVTMSAPEMQAHAAEAEARVGALEAQKAEAEAKLVAAQNTYERIKAASATPGAVAANELVLAEKAVEAARAVIRSLESGIQAAKAAVSAQRDLMAYLTVTAPFDGIITARWAHPGALAGEAGRPLLRLEHHSRLRLVVAVPEAESGNIPRGARVAFSVPAHPGETFTGLVSRVPNIMDSKTRTMHVELDVANENHRLAPGMYPEVVWPFRRSRPSLLVPPTAIVTTTERTFVIRITDGKAEWVDVVRGTSAGELVEVFGRLKEGDKILKRATDEIREGTPVTPKS
jgi:RND family efflux transporter MFP subunit